MSINKYIKDISDGSLKDNELYNLYKKPKKDSEDETPRFQDYPDNYIHQCDLLFLPNDNGYKYALTVADIGGKRHCDAEPIKTKESKEVLQAIQKIYSRKILQPPKGLQCDSGSEFKGDFQAYFKSKKIPIRYGKPDRHNQQAIVERRNQSIGALLFRRMSAQELITGEPDPQWVDELPKVIRHINNTTNPVKPRTTTKPLCSGNSCTLLSEGTKVRIQLSHPIDVATGNKLKGKFRSTDIRWNPNVKSIEQAILLPGQPVMYQIDGVRYTRNQLQVVSENEKSPLAEKVIQGKPTQYNVFKIRDKRTLNRKIQYQVQWKGYPKEKDWTWENRSDLIIDIPSLIKEYEQK